MARVIRIKAKEGSAPGWPGFMSWLAKTHPSVYNQARVSDPNTVTSIENAGWPGSFLSGDADTQPQQSMLDKLVGTITTVGATILPLIQQQKLLKIQLQRAQAGQQPLDVGQYVDPNQGVNVGLNPSTQRTLLYLGGGLLLAVMLPRLLRGR